MLMTHTTNKQPEDLTYDPIVSQAGRGWGGDGELSPFLMVENAPECAKRSTRTFTWNSPSPIFHVQWPEESAKDIKAPLANRGNDAMLSSRRLSRCDRKDD
ncbi:hypothetical protein CEXT_745361 [Caerostris extrusa]|uniref:Uncharacterized protein n=1 Tax=Caerostris extrusa TaxID=172846 RepID=A0AAV4TNM4_CAEEX|nr:hypothetical protein CEXT_745361 [Caerostris extrusa]